MSVSISNQPPSIPVPELRGAPLSITAGALAGTSLASLGTMFHNSAFALEPTPVWSRVGANAARGLVAGAVALADYEVVRRVRPTDDAWSDAGRGALLGAGIAASNVLAISMLADMSIYTRQSGRGRLGAVAIAAGVGALVGGIGLGAWSAAPDR